jgi:hypothetical protein
MGCPLFQMGCYLSRLNILTLQWTAKKKGKEHIRRIIMGEVMAANIRDCMCTVQHEKNSLIEEFTGRCT